MIAADYADLITIFSFSYFLNLKSKGVKSQNINKILTVNYSLKFCGNTVIVNPDFAVGNPQPAKGFLE